MHTAPTPAHTPDGGVRSAAACGVAPGRGPRGPPSGCSPAFHALRGAAWPAWAVPGPLPVFTGTGPSVMARGLAGRGAAVPRCPAIREEVIDGRLGGTLVAVLAHCGPGHFWSPPMPTHNPIKKKNLHPLFFPFF